MLERAIRSAWRHTLGAPTWIQLACRCSVRLSTVLDWPRRSCCSRHSGQTFARRPTPGMGDSAARAERPHRGHAAGNSLPSLVCAWLRDPIVPQAGQSSECVASARRLRSSSAPHATNYSSAGDFAPRCATSSDVHANAAATSRVRGRIPNETCARFRHFGGDVSSATCSASYPPVVRTAKQYCRAARDARRCQHGGVAVTSLVDPLQHLSEALSLCSFASSRPSTSCIRVSSRLRPSSTTRLHWQHR